MKKILAILMAVSLLVSMLCVIAVPASAYDPNAIVMSVSGMTANGSKILTIRYEDFAKGWSSAVSLALDQTWMDQNGVEYVVVELFADWTAKGGKFGPESESDSDTGFRNDTIHVPDNTKIIINMYGHTINRGLTDDQDDGEVIFMGKNSELIINGGKDGDPIVEAGKDPGSVEMGTIKGGYSNSGAGAIHMDGKGTLILNNVHIRDNGIKNDDGAGIAAYNNSEITMNGGSLSNNVARDGMFLNCWGGGMFLKNSTATLNNVVITGNEAYYGAALYLLDSKASLTNCIVEGNGLNKNITRSYTIFELDCSELEIEGGEIKNNGAAPDDKKNVTGALFSIRKSDITAIGEKKIPITGNHLTSIFKSNTRYDISCSFQNCEFTDNDGMIGLYYPDGLSERGSEVIYSFTGCTFNDNNRKQLQEHDFYANKVIKMTLTDCELGNSTFAGKEHVTFVDSDASNGAGSLFGEGSLTTIVAIVAVLALVASGTSIFMIADLKKKLLPATADNATED